MPSEVSPHSPEAERSFLGALLMRPSKFNDFRNLPDDFFFVPNHQRIYSAMCRCNRAGLPIDATTLSVYLDGNIADLSEIVAAVPASTHVHHYADILRRQHALRTIVDRCHSAVHLASRGNLEEARTLVNEITEQRSGSTLKFANLDEWWVVPEREWLFRPLVAKGQVTLICSPGGAGKSFLAVGLIAICVTGHACFDSFRPGGQHSCLYLSGEDDENEVRRRLLAYDIAYFRPRQPATSVLHTAVQERLHLLAAQSRPFLQVDKHGQIMETDYYNSVLDTVTRDKPGLIVVDTLRKHLGPVSENDNAAVGFLMELFARLARAASGACVVLHHANKGAADQQVSRQQDVRGASAAVDEARSVFVARRTENGIQLSHTKSNYGPTGTKLDFEFRSPFDGAPICLYQVGEQTPGQDRTPALAVALVEHIKSHESDHIGPGTLSHNRYSGPLMTALGCSWDELRAASDLALANRWIIESEYKTARHGMKPVWIPNPTRTAMVEDEPEEQEPNEDDELF